MDIGSFVLGMVCTVIVVFIVGCYWNEVLEPKRKEKERVAKEVYQNADKILDNKYEIKRIDLQLDLTENARKVQGGLFVRHGERLEALEKYVWGGEENVESEEESE